MGHEDLARLETAIGYHFADPLLCHAALTHSSYAYENLEGFLVDNQRLEFLGDAVLGLIVAGALYSRYPELPEGRLSRIKAALVCEETLNEIAQELGLGEHLRLGRGEQATGGAQKPSILSDAFEALLGAIFLDGGWDTVQRIVLGLFLHRFDEAFEGRLIADHKTALQEWVQAKGMHAPEYCVTERIGPAHDQRFTVEVKVKGQSLGVGVGSSKKEAQQIAAAEALERLSSAQEATNGVDEEPEGKG